MPYKCPEQRKEYQKKYHSVWYERNKEKRREQLKNYKIKITSRNFKIINEYLAENPCVDCGEEDPLVLEFDHKIRSEKTYNVSTLAGSGSTGAKLKHEISKCDVRCANCHVRRTRKQMGWFRRKDLRT